MHLPLLVFNLSRQASPSCEGISNGDSCNESIASRSGCRLYSNVYWLGGERYSPVHSNVGMKQPLRRGVAHAFSSFTRERSERQSFINSRKQTVLRWFAAARSYGSPRSQLSSFRLALAPVPLKCYQDGVVGTPPTRGRDEFYVDC
jgi:hypothetical protein